MDKKPTPQPEPPKPLAQDDAPDWMMWFATTCIIVGAVIVLAMLAGCAPPARVGVQVPAWMLTPVPTVDIGIPAIHAWDCMTEPEDVCTEWSEGE